ncbi:MAG: hypothetical protein HY908_00010 [Myxococcales bacterium]|nr:hypothetical protein [Myxococcales bacterium]
MTPAPRRSVPAWLRLACACALAAPLAACAAKHSKLEDGQSVTTGKKSYDGYFAKVAALRDKVKSLESDSVREALLAAVDVKKEASLAELMATTSQRAVHARDYGLLMGLRLSQKPKVVTVRGEMAIDPKDQRLLAAVEESATRTLERYREYSELLTEASELSAEVQELTDGVGKLPNEDPDRDLLRAELAGAERLLDDSQRKLQKEARSLARFALELAIAVDTGADAAQSERCDALLKDDGKPGKKPPKKPPVGPVGPVPPPPPKKPGGDFEM